MYAILKEQVASYALQDQVVKVVRVEDYSIPSGMLESVFTAAGQLLGSDGVSSPVVIAAPTVEGNILRARLGQTVKMQWETVDLAQLVQTAVKTAAYTAINNDHVLVDASGAGADFEIALPATPTAGNKVRVTMVAAHATYKVTIGRNGSLVNGGTSTTDFSLENKGNTIYFEYTGASLGWVALGADMMLASVQTVTGAKTFGSAGAVSKLKVAGTTSGAVTLDTNAEAGSAVVTIPAVTDTLVGKATTDTLTNKTLGNTQLGEVSLKLDAALSADGTWSGITEIGTAGAALAFGDLCYLQTADSRWELVDANLSAGYALKLGMCVLAAADASATEMLLIGKIRADAKFPTLTIGAAVYMSETAGAIVVAQPTTTDAAIRIVGFGNTADELYFNPSNDYITHT